MRLYADGEWFVMPEDHFDTLAEMFACADDRSEDDAVFTAECADEPWIKAMPKSHIIAAFKEHAELTGLDIEMAKAEVADLGDRQKAREELEAYIDKGGACLSTESAKTLIKIMDAFESVEFSHH